MAAERRRKRNTLRTLFPKDIIVEKLSAETREQAIDDLVTALTIAGTLPMPKKKGILEAILQRERVASTGIGNGIAIPHAKSKFIEKHAMAFGLAPHGIDFRAHDGDPVKVVVLVLAPPTATQEHLAVMRALASLARDDYQSRRLIGSPDKKSVLGLLAEIEV